MGDNMSILDNMFFQHFSQNTVIKKRNRNSRLKPRHKVICKNTGQIFANTSEAAKHYNMDTYQIYDSCAYKRRLWVGDQKMYFEFVEE